MENDQSKIEQLKKKLYSIADDAGHSHRSRLHPHASQVQSGWASEGSELEPPTVAMQKNYNQPTRKTSVLKRVLIVSLLALAAAGLFAWYIFTTGGNYVSASNIDIRVIGPVSTPAGEPLSLDIDVYNGNTERIETVDIIVQYPDGTRKIEDGSTTLLSDRLPIGDIAQGETARRTIKVLLFGEENVKKDIKLTVEYKVPGSVILFSKEKTYSLYIGSAPITIDVTNLKEVVPNQTTTFNVLITSNSESTVKNLLLKADFPAGFSFEKASPAASSNNNIWSLGDIAPGDKREIQVTGKIVGDANVERYFGFTAGTVDPLDRTKIAVTLVESKEKILVRKPFLAADFSLNKVGSVVYTTDAGQPIRGEIVWQNNLSVPLYDLILEMKLTGPTIDKKTVEGGTGFYTSQNNVITWDQSQVEEFKEILPNHSGSLQFTLSTLPPSIANNKTLRRQTVKLDLTVRAKRLSEDRVPEEIISTASKTVRVASGLSLNSRLVRNVGPFENTGPIPPRAEQASTYTVINSVTNSFNNVKDVTYKATLPSYVTWLGKTYPENSGAAVKYNPDTREISWTLGDMAPGTGFNTSAREFSYQVSISPSVSQVGQVPVVINAQRVAGSDTFTETIVEGNAPALGTNIESDPQFNLGMEKVVE